MTIRPEQCPRFDTCSAAVCPLDERKAVHLSGDRVCYYLTASGKPGAEERFQDDPIFEACKAKLPVIAARHPEIRRRVEAAARTGFRGKNLIGKAADAA